MTSLNVLFIGDIVGKPGIKIIQTFLKIIVENNKIDLVIANGENIADGKGITEKELRILNDLGVKVITGGNHIFEKQQFQTIAKNEKNVLRPLNYPRGTHGNGYVIFELKDVKIAVASLQGRAFMPPIDCPFRTADWLIDKVKNETKIIIIDFHAEATAEKIALAHYLDGRVSAVIGTHTHCQTADERILPKGTAYITDVGMTGPYDSVIGMKKDAAINRFLYQTPQRFQIAEDDVHLAGVILTIDVSTGKVKKIKRVFFPEFETSWKGNESSES